MKHSVRAVIDSATMIRLSFQKEIEYRQTLFEFLSLLRNLDCTTMTTVEATTANKSEMHFDIEHLLWMVLSTFTILIRKTGE